MLPRIILPRFPLNAQGVLFGLVLGLVFGTMGLSGYRRLKLNATSGGGMVRSVGGASGNKVI